MKEELIKLLDLPADASDTAVIAAVKQLLVKPAEEARIAKKIAQSGGALNREQAKLAIEHQDIADAAAKKAAKK
jgi:hypothetical protein